MKAWNRHLSDERLSELASLPESRRGSSDAEADHLARCERCREMRARFASVDRVLAGPWSLASVPSAERHDSRMPLRAARALGTVIAILVIAVIVVVLNAALPARPAAAPTAVPISTGVAAGPTETAGPSALPAVSSEPSATPRSSGSISRSVDGLVAWAPDSLHLIASIAHTEQGDIVLTPDGVTGWAFSARMADWLDASTIAAWTGPVQLFSVSGEPQGEVDGQFGLPHFVSGHREFAASPPDKGQPTSDDTYRIWDDAQLSAGLPGDPVGWSSDGTRLAVVHVAAQAVRGPGTWGWLSVVDGSGTAIVTLRDEFTNTAFPVAFSPDGRFLAACLAPEIGLDCTTHVVTLSTGSVADAGGWGSICWSTDSTLLVSDGVDAPTAWTPTGGVADAGIGPHSFVVASMSGELAIWSSDDRPTVTLRTGGSSRDIDLPGAVVSGTWSPDGRWLAVTSWQADPRNGQVLTILPVR